MPDHYRQEETQKKIQTLEAGDTFTSEPWIVSGAFVEVFLSLLGISHPVFFSDQYAQEWGFKSRISTGILTFSQLMAVLGRSGFLHGGIYLGTDKCRHMLPVYPGDTLRAQVEVLSKRSTSEGDRLVITYKWRATNQDEQVVSEGENTCLFPAS